MIFDNIDILNEICTSKSKIKPIIRGITNLGNTCYLNSLIQSLMSTSFPDYIDNYCIQCKNDNINNANVSFAIRDVFKCIEKIILFYSFMFLSIFCIYNTSTY